MCGSWGRLRSELVGVCFTGPEVSYSSVQSCEAILQPVYSKMSRKMADFQYQVILNSELPVNNAHKWM